MHIPFTGDGLVSREEFAAKSFVGFIPFFVECTFNYYDKMDGKKDGIMEEISINITYSILDPASECGYFQIRSKQS